MPSLGEHSASARIGQKPPRGTLIQDALPAYLMGPRRVIKNYKLPSTQLSKYNSVGESDKVFFLLQRLKSATRTS